jgi:hypothetical protein
MQLNRDYASFLLAAANIYAAQTSTGCSKAESQFEQRLFKLLEQASDAGVALQDIVVITSTAVAVMLTKEDALPPVKAPRALKGKLRAIKTINLV